MSPSSTTVGRVLRISSTKRIADRYGGAAEARNGLRWMCAGAPCTVVDAALRQKVQRRLPGKKRTTDRYKHRHCRFGRRTPSVRGPIKLMTVHNIISSLLHFFFLSILFFITMHLSYKYFSIHCSHRFVSVPSTAVECRYIDIPAK